MSVYVSGESPSWDAQNSQNLQPGGGSGWGSVTPTSGVPTGWGDIPPPSAAGDVSRWGSIPTSTQENNTPTGWGQSEKVEDQEALGTDIWGSRQPDPAAGQSAWNKPLGGPSGGSNNQWGGKANNHPAQQQQQQHQQQQHQQQPPPQQQPQQPPSGRAWGPFSAPGNGSQIGWGEASAGGPAKLPQTAWGGNPGNQGMEGGAKGVGIGVTQWGKKPVNQGTKWDVVDPGNVKAAPARHQAGDNGTAVWSGQQQNPPPPPPNVWNKEPPKSPWGNSGQQNKPPQPESAWGAHSSSTTKAWGNPDEPKPQAWTQPPPTPTQWSQPSNADNNRSGGSAWGSGAPPVKPPTSDSNYGSWNKEDTAKKQPFPADSQPPPQQPVPQGSGWLPMLDIPQEIVPTGWGQLSPSDPSKPFGMDDGTYVWGDSKEHNSWVTEMSAKNVLRMKQLKQKAAAQATAAGTSTMQSPSVPSSKPPSTPSSEDGAPAGFSSSTEQQQQQQQQQQPQKKIGGWDDPGTPTSATTSRSKSESESGGEWQSLPRTPAEETNKWTNESQQSSSSWGGNNRSSTQSRESMQTWNEEPANPSSSS